MAIKPTKTYLYVLFHQYPYISLLPPLFMLTAMVWACFSILGWINSVLTISMFCRMKKESSRVKVHRSTLQRPKHQFWDHRYYEWNLKETYRWENQYWYLWISTWINCNLLGKLGKSKICNFGTPIVHKNIGNLEISVDHIFFS